ncbi:MAG: type VI secretion system tip protein VgrG [Deltaproteobacteria bacterium]|nr:type VI secretion system tip protein VgrG [Deltaproteobacteria bacterium]
MAYTQDNSLIAVNTPLGKDVLLLTGFNGTEGLSRLFSFELDMLSENPDIPFADIIGKNVTVSILLADGEKRFFNGLISHFSQGRGEAEGGGDIRLSHYRAEMVPWLWLLTQTADSRIFQKLSAPEIVEKIFQEKGFSDFRLLLNGSYPKRDYCVQYRETDFNFVSRLLEEEGIYYFFIHEEKMHTLVLADAPEKHKPCPKQESAQYQTTSSGWLEEDVITSLEKVQEIRPGKYTLNDFNFEAPSTSLKVDVPSKIKLGPGEREVYDYPGLYAKKQEGNQFVNVRMEEEEARITTVIGSGVCRAFTSGYRFKLLGSYRQDMDGKEFILTSLSHGVTQLGYTTKSSADMKGFAYANNFTCIPFDVPYRPPRDSVKPVVRGTQTAIVVGPGGEEIYTDKYGRVKVQFHWDREGKRNENSSCWVRVAQLWAGPGWGAMYIPRIGQEVVVDFLEGDPDRPIIIGTVYHGSNMPPYPLPDDKTKSAIKSDSSLGGGGFNEIRFEDKKGQEQVFIHAEKNQDIRVKNNLREWIGNETHLIVKKDQLEMAEGDKHQTVKGDHNQKVDGTVSLMVATNQQEKVGNSYALEAGMEIHLKGGMNVVIESGTTLTLKVGGNFVNINPGGVFIKGSMVMINSGGAAGSGAGSSPAAPKEPQEADTAKPGKKPQLSPAAGAPSPQAQTLKSAAKSGTPFCET